MALWSVPVHLSLPTMLYVIAGVPQLVQTVTGFGRFLLERNAIRRDYNAAHSVTRAATI
jgi:hypothetical protein